MKVAFWGNCRNENYLTDYMAAISVMLSMNSNKKVVLMDNGFGSNSFEQVFQGIHRFYYVKEDKNYFMHRNGMDELLNSIHTVNSMEPLLIESAVEVIQNSLYYVPPSKVINHLVYEYELNQQLINIIHYYEAISDFIMVRARNGDNLSTKQVLEEADLVMVELTQNEDVLDEFFDNYSSIRQKAVFVFNQYKIKSLSIFNIMSKYHLKKEQVVILTEHLPISAAYLAGNLVSYLNINMNCNKESEHYRCIQELKRASKIILHYERSELIETIM